MRPTFRVPDLEARFQRDGYVVVPLLARRQVRELLRRSRPLLDALPSGLLSSIHNPDRANKQATWEVLQVLGAASSEHLVDFRPLLANFVVKEPGPDGEVQPHQDWTFVDEDRFRSVNVWLPLCATDDRNGALRLLRGGHRLPRTIRGVDIPPATAPVAPLVDTELVTVPTRIGEAIVYDHGVPHGSRPNRTRRGRIAAAMALVPAEAEALHHRAGATDGQVERFAVDPDFFVDYTYGQPELPSSAHRLDALAYSNPSVTEQTIHRLTGAQR